ncbi:unnamed protein product, partial [Didymodactylos carnosus]
MSLPIEVEVYVVFNKLTYIDSIEEKYNAEIDIVSSWIDNSIIVHPNQPFVYDKNIHWNPLLVFDNVIDEPVIKTRYEVKYLPDSKTTRVIQYQKLMGTLLESLEVHAFPFDTQNLGLIVTSLHPTNRLIFIPKQEYSYLAYKAVRDNQRWDFSQIISFEQTTYQEQTPYIKSNIYPVVRFNCLASRKSQFYIWNGLIPLFFITTTVFVSFSFDFSQISSSARISSCATTLLTSINFRFVINRYLPT